MNVDINSLSVTATSAVEVNLSEFLETVRPAWGGDTWDDAISVALNCPAEREVIDALIDQLARDGDFREPVRIRVPDADCVNDPDFEKGIDDVASVGNGMHRVIASILTGRDTVRVFNVGVDNPDELLTEIDFTLSPVDGMEPKYLCCGLGDGSWEMTGADYAFSFLRSIHLPGNRWATSDFFTSESLLLTGMWWVEDRDADALVDVLADRARRDGWMMNVASVRTLTVGEWEAEVDAEDAEVDGAPEPDAVAMSERVE